MSSSFKRELTAASVEAGLRIWNDTIHGAAVYELDRTQYAIVRERRNDYLHAVMNTANRQEF